MRGQGVVSGLEHPSPNPFPLGKGHASAFVAGDGDFLGDYRQNTVQILEDLVVPEADHAVAVGFDQPRAICVGGAARMLPAVELDGEAQAAAREVGDEVSDGVLAGEFGALNTARSQVQPQSLLRLGGFIAQLARKVSEAFFHYRRTPIPNPFPLGKGLSALTVSLTTISTASLAQNPAMTPRPLADWPGAEIAEGVAFQGDGSVTLEASAETGLPVLAFWRPVLHDEDSRYPVAGRMDCRVVAAEGPFEEAAFAPEARHDAVAEERREQGFIDMERLASGDDTVKQLDVIGRRNSPRSWYVLSYIMAREGERLVDIRRNCTFVFGSAASKPDVLPFVNRYTKFTFAFAEQDS